MASTKVLGRFILFLLYITSMALVRRGFTFWISELMFVASREAFHRVVHNKSRELMLVTSREALARQLKEGIGLLLFSATSIGKFVTST